MCDWNLILKWTLSRYSTPVLPDLIMESQVPSQQIGFYRAQDEVIGDIG
jgi:hypothetical protein